MTISPLILLLLFTLSSAQPTLTSTPNNGSSSSISFGPTLAITVGIFSIMFFFTVCLIMYYKYYTAHHRSIATSTSDTRMSVSFANPLIDSGIDKSLVDSLPLFRFSSLKVKGHRHNLDCAVCLSKFEESEILRLLPKCKHAFHIHCIDRWLEAHSTCPLCRHSVDPGDVALAASSSRSLFADNDQESDAELYIEEDPGIDGILEKDQNGDFDHKCDELHKSRNGIVTVSNMLLKSRWSELKLSDLASVDMGMLLSSSERFSAMAAEENFEHDNVSSGARAGMAPGNRNRRSTSEIRKVSRFRVGGGGETEEKVRRAWLPIARRTVQWFAGRERGSDGLEQQRQQSNRGGGGRGEFICVRGTERLGLENVCRLNSTIF